MSDQALAQESVPPGEAACIQNLAVRLKAKIIRDNSGGIMRRDAHPKMHGVVKAEFTVEAGLPDALRVGLFAEPKTYSAWIRFSNQSGTVNPDIDRDLRGMAMKLMCVPGEKLLQHDKHAQTQDFILISAKVFVTRDVEEFDAMIRALTGSLWAKISFFVAHWRVTLNLVKSMKRCANPLQIRYFSTTPYLLGQNAVKYCATPRVNNSDAIPDTPDDNYLRGAMARQLAQRDAVFDFAVQLQIDADEMPIENPAKEWDETLSPFRKVATIRILRQEFDSDLQREFGENLSFSPWHSLPEHRPLGGINRARKVVYELISQFRHQRNQAPRNEPVDWNIDA